MPRSARRLRAVARRRRVQSVRIILVFALFAVRFTCRGTLNQRRADGWAGFHSESGADSQRSRAGYSNFNCFSPAKSGPASFASMRGKARLASARASGKALASAKPRAPPASSSSRRATKTKHKPNQSYYPPHHFERACSTFFCDSVDPRTPTSRSSPPLLVFSSLSTGLGDPELARPPPQTQGSSSAIARRPRQGPDQQ